MNCSPRRAKNGMLIIKRQRSHAPDRSVWHWQLDWFESSDMFTFILSFFVQCFKSRCRRKGKIFETSRKQQFILRRLRHEKFLFTRRPARGVRLEIARPTATAELDFRLSVFPLRRFPMRQQTTVPSEAVTSPLQLALLGLTESRSRAHKHCLGSIKSILCAGRASSDNSKGNHEPNERQTALRV